MRKKRDGYVNNAYLVYQCGIANVFEVEKLSLTREGRNARRLYQGDFRAAYMLSRGLQLAGCKVKTAHCNMAGDIIDMTWSENFDDAPFQNQLLIIE